MESKRLWLIIIAILHFAWICNCQSGLSGSYVIMSADARTGHIVGNATVNVTDISSFLFSIQSITYYPDDMVMPIQVSSVRWRAPDSAGPTDNDCKASENYSYPRNQFCIQHSTGKIMTTKYFASRKPKRGSTYVLGIHVSKKKQNSISETLETVIRISVQCSSFLPQYMESTQFCSNEVFSSTSRVGNREFVFSELSSNRWVAAVSLSFDRITSPGLKIGDELNFQFKVIGEIPSTVRYKRILLVDPYRENMTLYRLHTLISTRFTSAINVEVRYQTNKTFSGSANAMRLYMFQAINYCTNEQCLVPLGNFVQSASKSDSPECVTLIDVNFVMPKYNSCLANKPPMATSPTNITLTIPNTAPTILQAINVTDPEGTMLKYTLTKVSHSTAQSSTTSTCAGSKSPICTPFNINANGTLSLLTVLSGSTGDKYILTVKVSDSGTPPRSVTITQNITLMEKCMSVPKLYQRLISTSSCLPEFSSITPESPSSNVTSLKFRYTSAIYKIVNSSVNTAGILDFGPYQADQLILQIVVNDGGKTPKFLRQKNVTQVLTLGKTVYDVNLDTRIDSNNRMEIRFYGKRGESLPKLFRVNAAAIKLYPYNYVPYCSNENCVDHYRNWTKAVGDLAARGVTGCDMDPRFVKSLYGHCTDPPRITQQPPKLLTLREGMTGTMSCEYFSFLPAQLVWYKDGKPFLANKEIEREGSGAGLVVQAPVSSKIFSVFASPESRGQFRCHVTNRYSSVVSNPGQINVIATLVGSYFTISREAKAGTLVGKTRVQLIPLVANITSIESVTYYQNTSAEPRKAQNEKWRASPTVVANTSDCSIAESYPYPRNLFCIQHSSGEIFLTKKYETMRPIGSSSFTLGIHVMLNGHSFNTYSPNLVVRISSDCNASVSSYATVARTCNRTVSTLLSARIVNNRTYSYSTGTSNPNMLVGMTIYLNRLQNKNLVVGDQLHFMINASTDTPSPGVIFRQYLLVRPGKENITLFRPPQPLNFALTDALVVELKNQRGEFLSGASNTMTLHIAPQKNYCKEETCLVPLNDWVNSQSNRDNPECRIISDSSYLFPKYGNCLANKPPLPGKQPEINLTVPTKPGLVLRTISVTDPEKTTLKYSIESIVATISGRASRFTCSSVKQQAGPCTFFVISASGAITMPLPVQGGTGDTYSLNIKVTDSGTPSRSIMIDQKIILVHRCVNITKLYSTLHSSSCPSDPFSINPRNPSSNVTILRYQYFGTIYKIINGSINTAQIVGFKATAVHQISLQVRVLEATQARRLLRAKNISVVLNPGKIQYDLNIDTRVDRGQLIEINLYGKKNGSVYTMLRMNALAVRIFPYNYENYCRHNACLSTYQTWRKAVIDMEKMGFKVCSVDPNFAKSHYGHCTEHPNITSPPSKGAAVRLGQTFSLTCGYFSYTPSVVQWFRDGKPFPVTITNNPREVRKRRGLAVPDLKPSPLTFDIRNVNLQATLENQGEYNCIVRNSYGATVSKKGLVRLTDVVTSNLTLRITDRAFHSDYRNKDSARYKALDTELRNVLERKFGKNQTGQSTTILINSITPGSVVVNAAVYSTGVSESSKRSDVCSKLFQAIANDDYGSFKVDTTRSETLFSDCCNSSETGVVEEKGRLTWPPTAATTTAFLKCPYAYNGIFGNATRTCIYRYKMQAIWDKPDISKCAYRSVTTTNLEKLSETPINSTNVDQVSKKLVDLTSNNFTTRLDVDFAAKTIENVLNATKTQRKVAADVLKSTSNIIEQEREVISKGQLYFNTSTRILRAVQKVADTVEIKSDKFFVARSTKNLALFVTEPKLLPKSGLSVTATLDAISDEVRLDSQQISQAAPGPAVDRVGSLFLPQSALKYGSKNTSKLRISTLFYKNSKLFASNSTVREDSKGFKRTSTSRTNSFILDATIRGLSLKGLSENVVSRFKPLEKNVKGTLSCVFWDFQEGGGNGAWSSRGCSEVRIENGFYRCGCDHLTHFAVLLDVSGSTISKEDEKALSIISYIGCAISLFGLVLTILTFLVFKNLRKKLPPRILICLCVSLVAVLIIFIAGIEKTSPRAGCQVVAIGLHYFVLTTFFWMGVEAYNLYRCFVIVVGFHMSMFLRKMSFLAWGIPLIIVAISAGVGIDHYGNDKHCMVTGLPFYVAFAAPVGIILAINLIMFFFVLRGMTQNKVAKDKDMSTLSKARIGVACSVLLGLTWTIGFLAIDRISLPLQYMFCILNSLQGFFIFVFYCLRNKDVRREWLRVCCKKSSADQSSSNAGKYHVTKGKKESQAGLFPSSDKRTSIPTESSYISMKVRSPTGSIDSSSGPDSMVFQNQGIDGDYKYKSGNGSMGSSFKPYPINDKGGLKTINENGTCEPPDSARSSRENLADL